MLVDVLIGYICCYVSIVGIIQINVASEEMLRRPLLENHLKILNVLRRCFYLAKSYSLAGKRAEAYALYARALSLADAALQKLRSMADTDQVCTYDVLFH